VDQSRNLSGNGEAVNENTGINAAFRETRGSLYVTQKRGRTTLTFGGNWAKQEYAPDVPLDSHKTGFKLALFRNLTRSVDMAVDFSFTSREFIYQGDDQDEIKANFRIKHKIGRSLGLNWGGDYVKQESETTNSYDEWRVSLELRYIFTSAQMDNLNNDKNRNRHQQQLSLSQ
jgi:hypothetical protein